MTGTVIVHFLVASVVTVLAVDDACSINPDGTSLCLSSDPTTLIQSRAHVSHNIDSDKLNDSLDKPNLWFWGSWVQIDHGPVALAQDKHAAFRLTPPSDKPYQLGNPNKQSYSQWGQDLLLQPILQKLGKGFFVEAGALGGEVHSNTLFYEKLGWTGLLIEPNPKRTNEILGKHRKSYFFKGCLSPTPHEQTLHFQDDGGDGGLSHLSSSGSYKVLGAPLQDLVQSIGRKTVDFWSLDVEGSESMVLKATDFARVEVGVLLIEMNKNSANNNRVKEVMHKEGFVNIGHTNYDHGSLDQIFVNPKYFVARGLAVPTGADLPAENRNS